MTTDNQEQDQNQVFEDLLEYLRRSRGFDFTGYKRSNLMRRVRKQMQAHEFEQFEDYLDYLQVHPEEFLPLFNTILINVTAFFRDSAAWKYLQQQALPRLLADKPANAHIRVWSAGCASGEEAYTLAMLFAEALGMEEFRQRVKIYATDVDEDALGMARQAVYSNHMLQPIPAPLREKYFEPVGDHWVVYPELRRRVIFVRHDLVQDAPISRLDLLVCRNTLMYFNAETQSGVLGRFHFALNDSGVLFLGKAEMLLTHANLFMPISLQHRLFRRVPLANRRERVPLLPPMADSSVNNGVTRYVHLRESAFDTNPYAQIVVDQNGSLVLVNAKARDIFDINFLDQGRPLQDLEISYRPIELRTPIEQVYTEHTPLTITDVSRPQGDDDTQYLDIHITPFEETTGEIIGVSITFVDVTRYHNLQSELHQSNQDLETANEELQSSNEELETTNEELQSTNEELETMNEELQSTNEELQTINEELRQRTSELNQVNAFLKSILTSLRAAVIVVNTQYNILTWNTEAENMWGLRADEVQGESIFGLDIGLPVDRLREPIRRCLVDQIDREELTLEAINRRGRTIQCRISFNPLIGFDKNRQGVILLMEEFQP